MKSILLKSLFAIGIFITSSHALACSYFIDDVKVQNDLGMNVLNKIGVSIGSVESLTISDYRWFESISTPMCPEELTYEGTFAVSFTRANEQGSDFCNTILKIKKVASWVGDRQVAYSFETIQQLTCTL